MKLFSLNWFKSEKQKELETLKVEEQTLKNALLKKDLERKPESLTIVHEGPSKKPYKRVKLVNDVLTVVLWDGAILTKPNATQKDYDEVRASLHEPELFKIVNSTEGLEEKKKEEREAFKAQLLAEGAKTLEESGEFEVRDNAVYMKGINRSIPQLLVERLVEVIGKNIPLTDSVEYQSLKKFWLKCCLNPNAQSAEDLYKFLAKHQFKIDKHGNFYAYRNVVSKTNDNKALVEFISNSYNKIKAVWKKKPSDYFVYEADGNYTFSKDVHKGDLGNLGDLYTNLPGMQTDMFTDAHTKKFDYKVGSVISMPRNDGDDNNSVSCSKGFHAASKAYDYSGFGDTSILVIINPIDVLAVPRGEDGKLRTCRWFFATTLSREEKYILDDDAFDVSDLGDVFEEQCMTNLQDYVQNSFAEEVKRHTFQIPQITASEMKKIVVSLEDMKEIISKRVTQIEEEE
jgi:hypothetical protein